MNIGDFEGRRPITRTPAESSHATLDAGVSFIDTTHV